MTYVVAVYAKERDDHVESRALVVVPISKIPPMHHAFFKVLQFETNDYHKSVFCIARN
jgi:hypothetical protein